MFGGYFVEVTVRSDQTTVPSISWVTAWGGGGGGGGGGGRGECQLAGREDR